MLIVSMIVRFKLSDDYGNVRMFFVSGILPAVQQFAAQVAFRSNQVGTVHLKQTDFCSQAVSESTAQPDIFVP